MTSFCIVQQIQKGGGGKWATSKSGHPPACGETATFDLTLLGHSLDVKLPEYFQRAHGTLHVADLIVCHVHQDFSCMCFFICGFTFMVSSHFKHHQQEVFFKTDEKIPDLFQMSFTVFHSKVVAATSNVHQLLQSANVKKIYQIFLFFLHSVHPQRTSLLHQFLLK